MFKTSEDLFPQSHHINGFSSKDGTHFWQSQKSFKSQEKKKPHYSKRLATLPSKNKGCENKPQKAQKETLIWSCVSTSQTLTMPKKSRSHFIHFHILHSQFRLDPSKIWSPRHGNIFKRDKAKSNPFWGCDRASKLQQPGDSPKRLHSSTATSSNTKQIPQRSCKSHRHHLQNGQS